MIKDVVYPFITFGIYVMYSKCNISIFLLENNLKQCEFPKLLYRYFMNWLKFQRVFILSFKLMKLIKY